MTNRLMDLRLIVTGFLLVVALMGVTIMGDDYVSQGQAWYPPDVESGSMPHNDCGQNYTLKLVYMLNGQVCEVTKGTASKDYVERLAETFKSEGDVIASPIERALHYIENVVWKYGGYSPK